MAQQGLKSGAYLKGDTYRIEKVLGQGSFGITYLATAKFTTQGNLGKMDVEAKVAIKEFFMSEVNGRSEDGSTVEGSTGSVFSNYRKKFKKEAENLSKLEHPNIVKVFDVFDENNTTYYVMEFLEGQNLDDYIKDSGFIKEEEAIRIVAEIGRALAYMHSQNMLHLDIKPKNIMRKADGKDYLIDFGLSKQFTDDGEPESSTSIGLGTPGYAPIEQAGYKQDGSFPATLDVYALGATMFKMLTGKRPPEATYILNDGFPENELNSKEISGYTQAVLTKAMDPIRKQRYQSINSFINEFEESFVMEFEDDVTTVDSVPRPKPKTKPKSKSKRKQKTIPAPAPVPKTELIPESISAPAHIADPEPILESEPATDSQPEPSRFLKFKEGLKTFEFWIFIVTVTVFWSLLGYRYGCNRSDISETIQDPTIAENRDVFVSDSINIEMDNSVSIEKENEQENEKTENIYKFPEMDILPKVKAKEIEIVDDVEDWISDDKRQADNKGKVNDKVKTDDKQLKPVHEEDVYLVCDIPAEFPGGMAALLKWLSNNLQYPEVARQNNVQGRVMVKVIVTKDGSIKDPQIVGGLDKDLDKEALRVVTIMPRWNPGKNEGVPVNSFVIIPINFRLPIDENKVPKFAQTCNDLSNQIKTSSSFEYGEQ